MENKNKQVSFQNETEIINSLTALLTEANIEYDAISSSFSETTIMVTVPGNQKGKVVGIIACLSPENKYFEEVYKGVSITIEAISNLKNSASSFPGMIKFMISVGRDLATAHTGIEELAYIGYTSDVDTVLVIEPSRIQDLENGLLPFEFLTEGLSFHGSAPQLGVNAIDHMRIFLRRLNGLLAPMEAENENSYHVLEFMEGGSAPNTIPDNCTARVNIYTKPALFHEIRSGIEVIKLELENELRRFRLTINPNEETQSEIGDWAKKLPVTLVAPEELTVGTISKFLH